MSSLCLRVLKAPVITEKSTMLGEKFKKYVLLVDVSATKPKIKKAIELFYGVKVGAISVALIKGKKKRFKGVRGSRSSKKKVYFSLLDSSQVLNVVEA